MTDASPFAALLDELAPYRDQALVVKIGGNSIDEDPSFLSTLARQIAFLRDNRVRVAVVHGGGPQIDRALEAAGHSRAKGSDGRRITTPPMMEIVSRVMAEISDATAAAFEALGAPVFAATREALCFVQAKPLAEGGKGADEDRTGMPVSVDAAGLSARLDKGEIAVLTSLGRDANGFEYNINADDTAMEVAIALKARRLVMATNVSGVLDGEKKLISRLSPEDAARLIAEGVIAGGMIPKVESAVRALTKGVSGVAIINAHENGALLAELLSPAGRGTLVTR